jgi:membrane-bound metal-dependent hydrolase YbcI (DUF457 family)
MTLLAFAPLAYVLASDGKFLLAGVYWLGIQAIEPLPDQDFWLPGLSHRGLSHSLLAVSVVGSVFGVIGWVLGGFGFDLLYRLLATFVGVWDWLLGFLPALSTAFLTGLIPNLPPEEIVITLQQQTGESVNRWSFAVFGFGVGVYGMVAHLLGDVITTRGIKPLLPVSNWRLSLGSLRADSPTANSMLFGAGTVVITLIVVATVPGIMGVSSPAGLSPVGVVSAQENNSSNTSQPSVTMPNQTTNGTSVTVTNATLSRGGYIVVHSGAYQDAGVLQDSAIATSGYLEHGTHGNVTIPINRSPPGGNLNQSKLNGTDDLTAVLWHESGNNTRFEGITSGGTQDTPYTVGEDGSRRYVTDTSQVIVNETRGDPNSTTERASVAFEDQETTGSTITVENATLPDGGWVVVNNESYESNPTGSAVGISPYLKPGTHRNVTVSLLPGAVSENQTLIARPSRDTNGNQQYDYVQSDGFEDTGYTLNGSSVSEGADITLTNAGTGTSNTTQGQAQQPPLTAQSTTALGETAESGAADQSSGNSGVLGAIDPVWAVAVVVVLIALQAALSLRSKGS